MSEDVRELVLGAQLLSLRARTSARVSQVLWHSGDAQSLERWQDRTRVERAAIAADEGKPYPLTSPAGYETVLGLTIPGYDGTIEHYRHDKASIVPSALKAQGRRVVLAQEPFALDWVPVWACHAYGVAALMEYPPLVELVKDKWSQDVIERAQELQEEIGSIGTYSHSKGVPLIRKHVAKFIEERDGYPSDPEDIFLTAGASAGISGVMPVAGPPQLTGTPHTTHAIVHARHRQSKTIRTRDGRIFLPLLASATGSSAVPCATYAEVVAVAQSCALRNEAPTLGTGLEMQKCKFGCDHQLPFIFTTQIHV
ncbi:hypothetical protein CERSUDRAFT_96835 [Gelatoporia subvermispora B]|uniref:Uncharacterized protein n=1 Tax=Ceriporiopsis subvermispora (strain B) TaxID=914234 RepID=M2QD25_CERS8|nr:hypothetical protein CERSUDRAFT_96835 [Gelatoporia subvermispora B]